MNREALRIKRMESAVLGGALGGALGGGKRRNLRKNPRWIAGGDGDLALKKMFSTNVIKESTTAAEA